ncbi:ribbon-helix-helix domain-containing protein [Tolypothrix sp. VBCCA 56010]|uniref:ribbon-helix-helix domain-containing protein n=1 Tax=Tolypothrix sp. VBCCA 56010 TaxID=3137731 RepID=UPI003D7CA811
MATENKVSQRANKLQQAASADKPKPAPVRKEQPANNSKSARPPSRQGKKALGAFVSQETSKQLKQIALDENTSVQDLVVEALNDLFVKYGKRPIAE